MEKLGMPFVEISFEQMATREMKKLEQGTVALILREDIGAGTTEAENSQEEPYTLGFEVLPSDDISKFALSEENKEQIRFALMGNQKKPKKVVVAVIGLEEEYTRALDWLALQDFQYLAVPSVATDKKEKVIADWVATRRANKKLVKAVLPNYEADSEYIINFATDFVTISEKDKEKKYTTEQYCPRIAGLLAGTELKSSCTYSVLPELSDCARMERKDMDEAVGAGKLLVFHDGEKVKVARGVNSLVTLTETKGNQFKKIKVIEAIDNIQEAITKTVEDNYIGKVPNSFDNKCLLISDIKNFYETLVRSEVLEAEPKVDIDIKKNTEYLLLKGVDISELDEVAIRKANTEDKVFLESQVKINDVMEEITIKIEV